MTTLANWMIATFCSYYPSVEVAMDWSQLDENEKVDLLNQAADYFLENCPLNEVTKQELVDGFIAMMEKE